MKKHLCLLYASGFLIVFGIYFGLSSFFHPSILFLESSRDTVHFLSFSDGDTNCDSILLETNGHYALIDASNPSPVFDDEWSSPSANGQTVADYMDFLGVKRLDFVLGTHNHSDHIGGIPDIVSRGFVDQKTVYLYKPYIMLDDEQEISWKNDIYAIRALDAISSVEGHSFDLSKSGNPDYSLESLTDAFKLETFQRGDYSCTDSFAFHWGDYTIRLYNLYQTSNTSENTNSVVCVVSKGKHTVWLGGDVDVKQDTETLIAQAVSSEYETIDIYKISHHGNQESNGYHTLRLLRPKTMILTTGNNETPIVSDTSNPYVQYSKNVLNAAIYSASLEHRAIVADLTYAVSVELYSYNEDGSKKTKPEQADFIIPDSPTFIRWVSGTKDTYAVYYDSRSTLQCEFRANDGLIYLSDEDGLCTLKRDFKRETSGWNNIGNHVYYLSENGSLLQGWQQIGAFQYHFQPTGIMSTGWIYYKKQWYYLRENSGEMVTGWLHKDEKWYYLKKDGSMAADETISINGNLYHFNSYGVWESY